MQIQHRDLVRVCRMSLPSFLEALVSWVTLQPDIKGVALVGSYARETALTDSDIDLIILTLTPIKYIEDNDWLRQFGEVSSSQREKWGCVETVRSMYSTNMEVEFGFAPLSWAEVPVDAGTRRVVKDGFRILFDPDGMLKALQLAVV